MMWGRFFALAVGLIVLGSCSLQGEMELSVPLSATAAPALTEEEAPGNTAPVAEQLDVDDVGGLVSGYLRGVIAEAEGDSTQAAEGYAEVAAANPQNSDMLYRAFSMQLASGDISHAVAMARQLVLQQEQVTPVLRLLLLADAVKKSDFSLARDGLEELRRHNDDMLPFALLQAYIDLAEGQALDGVAQMVKDYPTSEGLEVEKNYHIGRMYEAAGEVDTALQYYAQGFLINPTYVPIITHLGRIYEQRGQFNKAVELYRIFDEMKPNAAIFSGAQMNAAAGKQTPAEGFTPQDNVGDVMFSLAHLMIAQESYLMADQFLQMARYLRPQDAHVVFYQGVIAEHSQDYTRAVAFYRAIPDTSGLAVAAHLRTAQTLSALEKDDEAIAVLSRMIKKGEKADLARQTIAEIYYNQKNYARALPYYNRLLEGSPKKMTRHEAALYFARGTALERLQQLDRAAQDIEKSLAIFPDNPVALNYIGYMLVDSGRDQKRGKAYIERALALKPEDGSIVDSLGWAYYHEGDYAAALSYLERAATLLPADPTVSDHLGDVYFKQGRINEARTQWLRALRLEPDEADTRRNINIKLQSLQAH